MDVGDNWRSHLTEKPRSKKAVISLKSQRDGYRLQIYGLFICAQHHQCPQGLWYQERALRWSWLVPGRRDSVSTKRLSIHEAPGPFPNMLANP